MKLNLSQIADAYKQACARIQDMIKASSFKITHIMEEIGLGRAAFYDRLNKANWEPKHLETFQRIFDSEPKRGAVTTM